MLTPTRTGRGVGRIVREAGAVPLTPAEPKEYRAADAEALTEQVLGFRLPLAGLADWVRARPAPSRTGDAPAKIQKSSDGRMQNLEQQGWKIEYQEYAEGGAEALPSRLRLTYPGIELRLVISRWN